MKSEQEDLSESERLRLGRQFLDGGSFEWLSERAGRSKDEIVAAWEYCREMLSRSLAAAESADFRLLSDDDIRAESERCLRLLLEWQEAHDRCLVLEKAEANSDAIESSSGVEDVDCKPARI